jgi:hypothetical protein
MEAAVLQALSLLVRVFIVYCVFAASKRLASGSKCHRAKACAWAVGASSFLAFLSWQAYGTPFEDPDPLYGGGEEVVDFEPTAAQRNQHGLVIFMVLAITSVVGTHLGLKDRANREGM